MTPLKRKRSAPALMFPCGASSCSAASASSGASLASVGLWEQHHRPHVLAPHDVDDDDDQLGRAITHDGWARNAASDEHHPNISGRTKKRIRDGRPSEDVIHGMKGGFLFFFFIFFLFRPMCFFSTNADDIYLLFTHPRLFLERTLRILYSAAQQQHQHQQAAAPLSLSPHTPSSTVAPTATTTTTTTLHPTQPSLHTFWPSSFPPRSTPPPPPPYVPPPINNSSSSSISCQDCDAPILLLRLNDATTLRNADQQQEEGQDEEAYLCTECARLVCTLCAVVVRDDDRGAAGEQGKGRRRCWRCV